MGIMIIPMISSLTEDALCAVPNSLREGAYALGATKLSRPSSRVIVPAALSGIAASVILALSRAIGETMIVAIAAGQQPRFTLDPRVPIETMTAYIVQVSMGDMPTGTLEYRTIFAVGSALFVMTFVMNVISHRLAASLPGALSHEQARTSSARAGRQRATCCASGCSSRSACSRCSLPAAACWRCCSVDVVVDGMPAARAGTFSRAYPSRKRRARGHLAGARRHACT